MTLHSVTHQVMPCDYDDTHGRGDFGRPVELPSDLGEFEPLEMIWSAEMHGGADLPLRPAPRKGRR